MSGKKIPVIIDTDPGVDDVIAILLALASPEIEILAIIVSFGNTDIESSYLNIFKVYHAVSQHLESHPGHRDLFPNFSPSTKTILARGPDGPLEGDLHSAQYFHGRDGLGGITERHPELNTPLKGDATDHPQLQLTDKRGTDVALELLRAHPARSITYIALGPLTGLAQMMRTDRAAVQDLVGRIVCMGGALDVPGNTSPVAEFNFFADPYAVKELLLPTEAGGGLPLDRFILLPLDITTPHELPFPVYEQLVDPEFQHAAPSSAAGKSPIAHFTSSFLEKTRAIMLEFGKDAMELHDIVAVWCAIENPPDAPGLGAGWEGQRRKFDIERTGEITRGMLVVDRRDFESTYAPGTNRAAVQAELDRAAPARVEVEHAADGRAGPGVFCVTATPGPAAVLRLLLARIWGR